MQALLRRMWRPSAQINAVEKAALTADTRLVHWRQGVATPIEDFDALPITALSAGLNHSVALVNQRVVCWGSNAYGQCGPSGQSIFSASDDDESPPSVLKELQHASVVRIASGYWHTLAVSDEGQLFAWGAGVLGHGEEVYDAMPRQIDYFGDHGLRVVDLAARNQLSIVLTESEDTENIHEAGVYVWGYAAANRQKALRPLRLPFENISRMAAGHHHACLLSSDTNKLITLFAVSHQDAAVMSERPFHPHFDDNAIDIDSSKLNVMEQSIPIHIVKEGVKKVIAASGAHNLILTDAGALYALKHAEVERISIAHEWVADADVMPDGSLIVVTESGCVQRLRNGQSEELFANSALNAVSCGGHDDFHCFTDISVNNR